MAARKPIARWTTTARISTSSSLSRITTGYGWTDELGSYAEWFMFAPAGAETAQNQQYFNTGVTYLISDNIQWDIRAGVGLNEAADDFFTGSGISIRMY